MNPQPPAPPSAHATGDTAPARRPVAPLNPAGTTEAARATYRVDDLFGVFPERYFSKY